MDAKQMGIFISELRKENGMTQLQLANKLQVSDKAVSRWERGLGFPDISTLEPLAIALNISILELMQCRKMLANEVQLETSNNAINSTFDIANQQMKLLFRKTIVYSVIGIIGLVSLFIGLAFHSYGYFSLLSRPIILCLFGTIMILIFLCYMYGRMRKIK